MEFKQMPQLKEKNISCVEIVCISLMPILIYTLIKDGYMSRYIYIHNSYLYTIYPILISTTTAYFNWYHRCIKISADVIVRDVLLYVMIFYNLFTDGYF